MAAGQEVAALPAGPHWTEHPPGSRGSSWYRGVTHTTPQSEGERGMERGREGEKQRVKMKQSIFSLVFKPMFSSGKVYYTDWVTGGGLYSDYNLSSQ